MAKRMSIEDIVKLTDQEVRDMTVPELRKAVADASRLANQRMRRLEQSKYGEFSRSYQSHKRRGKTRFGVGRGKVSPTKLRNELKASKTFLTEKTSSVTGTKEVRRKVNQKMGYKFKTFEEEREFWRTYRLSEEKFGASYESTFNGSGDVQKALYRIVNNEEHKKSLLRDVNRMNQGDRTDAEVDALIENGKFINSEGHEVTLKDSDSYAELMKEYANKKVREGAPKDDNRKYKGLSSRGSGRGN